MVNIFPFGSIAGNLKFIRCCLQHQIVWLCRLGYSGLVQRICRHVILLVAGGAAHDADRTCIRLPEVLQGASAAIGVHVACEDEVYACFFQSGQQGTAAVAEAISFVLPRLVFIIGKNIFLY